MDKFTLRRCRAHTPIPASSNYTYVNAPHHLGVSLSLGHSLHEGHDLLLHRRVKRKLLTNQLLYPLVELNVVPEGESEVEEE